MLSPLAQLLSIVFWTHLADAQTVGILTLVTSSQELAGGASLLWWSHYLMRHYFEFSEKGALSELMATSRLAITGIVILQPILAVSILLLFIDPSASGMMIVVVALFGALRIINQYFALLAVIRYRPMDNTVHSLAGPFGGLLLGIALLAICGSDPIWPLLGYLCGDFVGAAFGVFRAERASPRALADWRIISESFRYGAPLTLQNALSWTALNSPRFIVAFLLGLDAAGEFAVGFGLGQRSASLAAMAVTVAALPLAINQAQAGGRIEGLRQLAANGALLLGVTLPAVVGLSLVGVLLTPLIIAEPFRATTNALLPWSAASGLLLAVTSHYLNHIFLIDRRTSDLAKIELIAALATAILAVAFVQQFGIIGGVWAIGAVRAVNLLVVGASMIVARGLIVPWRDSLKIVASTLIMSAGVMLVPDQPGWVALLLKIALGALIYVGMLLLLYARAISALRHVRIRRTIET